MEEVLAHRPSDYLMVYDHTIQFKSNKKQSIKMLSIGRIGRFQLLNILSSLFIIMNKLKEEEKTKFYKSTLYHRDSM